MEKKSTALFRSSCLVSILLLSSVFVFAQVTVSGKVTDESNKPLEGVTVEVEGKSIAASTKADGSFQINAVSANAVLQFSFVGYTSQKVNVNNRTQINVALTPADASLQSIVVVGYGTRKKS